MEQKIENRFEDLFQRQSHRITELEESFRRFKERTVNDRVAQQREINELHESIKVLERR